MVDDDATIRSICCDILHQAGYSTNQAESGIEALADAKRFRPDLLLMDVMMPELDGFETAERLRAEPSLSMTPIIFLSARGETADKVRAFRIGAEDYVVKPFVAAELVARVQKALERRDRELGASPTTQLPGAGAIESEIDRRLTDPAVAFCYLDLDNLKAFNDYYGYAKADGIIRQTGDLVRDGIARQGSPGDFVGHIAGDDFVFITDHRSSRRCLRRHLRRVRSSRAPVLQQVGSRARIHRSSGSLRRRAQFPYHDGVVGCRDQHIAAAQDVQ